MLRALNRLIERQLRKAEAGVMPEEFTLQKGLDAARAALAEDVAPKAREARRKFFQ